jgi:prephenate dehydrogenase
MIVCIIGLGLIGGSLAIALKENQLTDYRIGVDNQPNHQKKALELGLVEEIADLATAVKRADLVIVAVPVNITAEITPKILNIIDNQVVMEVGSTKLSTIEATQNHPKRARLVATHPMWGTEYSGPEAAVSGAFKGRVCVICNPQDTDNEALIVVEKIYRTIGMNLMYMNAFDHDLHTAYVSHISHITSFALANTVLEKEKKDEAIFALASGGFESTVRLAKSNANMWTPIFKQNKANILEVLTEHIAQLEKFKTAIEKEDSLAIQQLIENANQIKRIIK